ncbi:MAG: hypothetical protein KJ607_09680 [Bacteroidetes bacterium]|nr:hypothetical protein [Bacteroidota bacterium]
MKTITALFTLVLLYAGTIFAQETEKYANDRIIVKFQKSVALNAEIFLTSKTTGICEMDILNLSYNLKSAYSIFTSNFMESH